MSEAGFEPSSLVEALSEVKPFSLLPKEQLLLWFSKSRTISFEIGARFLRPDQLTDSVFYIKSGRVRCLGIDPLGTGQVTISTAGEETLWMAKFVARSTQ